MLAGPQAEACAQVRLEIGLLLDCRDQRLVDSLLVGDALGVDVLLLRCGLALLEESILALALLLLASPVLVLAHAVQDFAIEVGDIDGCAGCDYVAVVDAAQRHAVGLEGTGDQENALRELAQENDTLAGEATGEEDQDGAGLERLAVFGGVGGLAGLVPLAYDRHIASSQFCSAFDMETLRCLGIDFGAYLLHQSLLLRRVVAGSLLFASSSRHCKLTTSRSQLESKSSSCLSTSSYYLQLNC